MKKRLGKILLTILLFVFGLGSASAATFNIGDQYNKNKDDLYSINGLSITNNGKTTYGINGFSFVSVADSSKNTAFCLDAHKLAANGVHTVERLMLQNSDSPLLKGYDAGIIEILKIVDKGSYTYSIVTPESTPNNHTATLEGKYLYVAASIAIRSLTDGAYLWGGEPTLKINGKLSQTAMNQVSAHVTQGLRWAALYSEAANKALNVKCGSGDAAVTCYQQRANQKYNSNGKNWYNNSEFTWGERNSEGYNVIYGAQQLFKIAIEKAAEVREKGISTPSISHNLGNAQNIEKNENFVRESYTLSINFSNFDAKDGKLNNIWVSCPECNINGVVQEAVEFRNPKTGNWETLVGKGNANFLTYFNAKGGKVSGSLLVRLTVRKPSSENGCKNVQFQIHYGFSDPELQYQGAVLKYNNDNNQRFVILNKVNDGERLVYGTIGCAPCETEVSVPVCSDDPKKAVATIKAPSNIKKCILNNWDDAGNSYQLSTSNGGVSNDYCGVFCKEDYATIRLNPVVKNVVCGGYFQLKSHIEGKKDCYTAGNTADKQINRTKYNEDIKKAQEAMIDAYNEYARWLAGSQTSGVSKNGGSCGSCGSCTATDIERSWTYTAYNYNGTTYQDSDSMIDRGGTSCAYRECDSWKTDEKTGKTTCTSRSCNGTSHCGTGSDSVLASRISSNLSSARRALTDAINKYESIIANFNACTTGWTNDYEFAQKIKYYFNEYRYNQAYTPYYDLLMSADKDELYYLDKVKGSLKENSSVTICLDGANDDYSCRGRYVTFKGEVDKTKTDKYNYNSSYINGIFEDERHIVCSTSGCKVETRKVSQAKFVKKTVEKEQDYITPSAFYQTSTSGRITVNSGYVGNVVQLHAIKNGLPVSTRSNGGGIFKLQLEDLGEFYDNGELGRLFDFQGKNEDKSVAKNSNKGVGTFTGQYTCHYKNSCRPDRDPCPNCEFVCDDEDCEWKECPDCKFDCVNCLFNEGNLNINFKPISSTNFGSSGRKYGYNWITTSKIGSLGLLNEKADKTISDIIKDNETIYIDPDKATDDSSLAFSIKLTKEVINKIKDYNKENEDKGGYANDSLTCKNAVVDGVTYENIYCYSELIDKLVDEHSDLIIVKNRDDETKYWTLWESPKLKDESLIGGPAWK